MPPLEGPFASPRRIGHGTGGRSSGSLWEDLPPAEGERQERWGWSWRRGTSGPASSSRETVRPCSISDRRRALPQTRLDEMHSLSLAVLPGAHTSTAGDDGRSRGRWWRPPIRADVLPRMASAGHARQSVTLMAVQLAWTRGRSKWVSSILIKAHLLPDGTD